MRGKNNTGIGLWTQYKLASRRFFQEGKLGKEKWPIWKKWLESEKRKNERERESVRERARMPHPSLWLLAPAQQCGMCWHTTGPTEECTVSDWGALHPKRRWLDTYLLFEIIPLNATLANTSLNGLPKI